MLPAFPQLEELHLDGNHIHELSLHQNDAMAACGLKVLYKCWLNSRSLEV